MANIKVRDIQDLQRKLETINRRGLPYAARFGLNDVAFAAQRQWRREMDNRLTLRNKFTQRSVRVLKAKGRDIDRMESVTGSDAPWMGSLERGGGKTRKGVPTTTAAGQGRGSNRTKPVRIPNRLRNIDMVDRKRGGSRRQRNATAIARAKRTGQRFAYLELERTKGIFRVSGGKRSTKVDLMYNMNKPLPKRPAKPTGKPTLKAVSPRIPLMMKRQLERQIARSVKRSV